MEKKTPKKPTAGYYEVSPETAGKIIRRQLAILAVVAAAAGLIYGAWWLGDDRGWGNAQRAFTTKMSRAQQAMVDRKLELSIALYKQVISRYPDNPGVEQAYTGLASSYEEAGRVDQAIETHQTLLTTASNPDLRAYTQLEIGKLYASKSDADHSREFYEKVLAGYPKSDWAGEALAGLGQLYESRRDYKAATGYFQKIIKEFPKGFLAAEAQASIGECLEAEGRTKQALKAYQVVLDQYPSAVWDQAKQRIETLNTGLKAKAAREEEGMSLAALGEFGLIAKLVGLAPKAGRDLRLGPGDDACVFSPKPGFEILATCDLLVEKVHFDLKFSRPWSLGAKALAASLSDIAAMGGRPRFFLVSLALPRRETIDEKFMTRLYRGMLEEASAFGAELAGGDTTASPGPLMIDVFMLGEAAKGKALTRKGARPGDAVFCTGTLGDSAAGLACLKAKGRLRRGLDQGVRALLVEKHLLPRPRVLAGRWLADNNAASASIDLSDGLSSELHHLAQSSGVGFEIFAGQLPLSLAARAAGRSLKKNPLQWALHGGEDYELLFTTPPAKASLVLNQMQRLTGTLPHAIGRVTARSRGVRLVKDGQESLLKPLGFDHFKRSR